jgi:hypothetical protein
VPKNSDCYTVTWRRGGFMPNPVEAALMLERLHAHAARIGSRLYGHHPAHRRRLTSCSSAATIRSLTAKKVFYTASD